MDLIESPACSQGEGRRELLEKRNRWKVFKGFTALNLV